MAELLSETGVVIAFEKRTREHAEEKTRIGQKAASLVKDGQTIIVDAGTTTAEIVKCLDSMKLNIITNALNIATLLEGEMGINLTLVGGQLVPETHALVGPLAEKTLNEFYVDTTFLAVSGIFEDNLTNDHLEEVSLKQLMIKQARETILVADSSKFGKKCLARIDSIDKIDTIITDKGISKKYLTLLRRKKLKVILV